MEFKTDLKNYYNTINEAKQFRQKLWEKNSNILNQLKQDLFDEFSIEENIFIINEFFDKSIFNLSNMSVLLELSKDEFEQVVDSGIIPKYKTDDIDFYIHIIDEGISYHYNGMFFKKQPVSIDIKKNYV